MALSSRLILFALALTMSAPLALACKSAPEPADEPELELTAAEDLIQTPDTLAALRVNLNELEDLTPLFQRLAQSSNEPLLRDLADMSPDPVGHLAARYDLPNELPSLDRDAPTYVMVSNRGNQSFFQAAYLGLPTRSEEWPEFFNFRFLLPGTDVTALRQELDEVMGALGERGLEFGAYELYEGPGFVRMEVAMSAQGTSTAEAAQWLAERNLDALQPPSTADFRPTPAFDAFVSQDTPFGLWAPDEAFTALATLEELDQFIRDYDQVGPRGKPRFFLNGVARLATPSAVSDPVAAENEDLTLSFSPQGEDAVAIDLYTTRTARGVELFEATAAPISLPRIDHPEAFLSLRARANLAAAEPAMAEPYWTTVDTGWNDDDMAVQIEESTGGGLAGVDQGPAGTALLGMVMQYPWTTAAMGSDAATQMMPLPQAIAAEAFPVSDGNRQIPMGAVVIAAFDHDDNTRASIQQLLSLGESMVPGILDAELLDRDDDLLELRLAVNTDLANAYDRSADNEPIDAPEASLNLAAVKQYLQSMPAGQAASLFDTIYMRSLSESDYGALRITVGGDEGLPPEALTSRVEPRAVPTSRCRTEMAAAAVVHLRDLRGDSAAQIEAWANEVETLANECMAPNHPAAGMLQERLELARELAAEIP